MKLAGPEKIERSLASRLIRISGNSLVLGIMTFLGLYAGIRLDRWTSMAPDFMFLGLILGIILGFSGFIREVIRERKYTGQG